MKKILFDTDLLGDDLLALFAMVKDPDVEIAGVTAYGRRIPSVERCKTACAFLEEQKISGIHFVPGVSHPLVRRPLPGCRYCDDVLCTLHTAWSHTKNIHNVIEDSVHAASFIVDTVKRNPKEFSLLCTGPLTNIALAVLLCPELPYLIKEITVMGGTWKECGNSSAVAEANIYNDPEAAKIVFASFPSVTIVPLDITMQVTIKTADLPQDVPSSVSGIVASCCRAHSDRGEDAKMPLHDVLAFLVMKYPDLAEKRKCAIHIETKSSKSSGMMIFDFLRGDHMLCCNVNSQKATEFFLELLER